MVELTRDLEVVTAMLRRANRRLRDATVELDPPQCAETHHKIDQAIDELGRLAAKLPQQQPTPGTGGRTSSRVISRHLGMNVRLGGNLFWVT